MTYSTVLPIWNAVRERFHKTANTLLDRDLALQLGNTKIGNLLHHTSEVEYMFAEWFFRKEMPKEGIAMPALTSVASFVEQLVASNEHIIQAMQEMPEEDWHKNMESPIGTSTPIEAVGRLIYHTGIHAGQISLIKKNGDIQDE